MTLTGRSPLVGDRHHLGAEIFVGQRTYTIPAHLDGVTSLSIDATEFSLVSGCHDCSIHFGDILGAKACIQANTNHRKKASGACLTCSSIRLYPS